jgi:hypothetical protein
MAIQQHELRRRRRNLGATRRDVCARLPAPPRLRSARNEDVFDCDSSALPPGAPTRYHRYGLGPARPAPKEGKGWLFAAGELAMTASDLAKWDIAMIDQQS